MPRYVVLFWDEKRGGSLACFEIEGASSARQVIRWEMEYAMGRSSGTFLVMPQEMDGYQWPVYYRIHGSIPGKDSVMEDADFGWTMWSRDDLDGEAADG